MVSNAQSFLLRTRYIDKKNTKKGSKDSKCERFKLLLLPDVIKTDTLSTARSLSYNAINLLPRKFKTTGEHDESNGRTR